MKTFYLKTIGKIAILLFVISICQPALGANTPRALIKAPAIQTDTANFQKPGRLHRPKKIKNEEKDQEDGVSDDIRARAHQEFLQQRDPKLNRVPVERLLTARNLRDQFVKARLIKPKTAMPPGNAPAPLPPGLSGLQWHERGPNNVGGRTRALIFDMNDAANGYKKVFAGGVGGGLWVTNDITATPVQWTKINDFFDNIAISCISQDPIHPQIIYAGTGEGFLNADGIQGLGVWKSSDGGATWAHLTSSVSYNYINAILVDRNGSVYLAGDHGYNPNIGILPGFGVVKSSDGGTTWTNVINANENGADLQLAANGDVYATTGIIYTHGHIYMSDFGVNGANTGNAGTWTNITPSHTGVITPTTTSWDRIKLALAPGDANIVYAFFETDQQTSLGSVQQYNKSANTWTVKTVPSEAFNNLQAWYSIAAAVDPNDPSVLYAGSLDAERSTDGGVTWTQYTQWNATPTSSNYVHADHHAYVYPPGSSTRLMMGTDGGVFYTVNATATPAFANKNNGYDVTQYYSVALHPTNFNYALAGAQDNGSQAFSSAGIGSTTEVTGGDGADVFIDQTNGNIQITSYVYDQYFVSTDNGATFNALSQYGYGQFINPTDYDPATKSLYAGSYSGHYFRIANVATSPAYNLVSVSGFNNANISAVTVAPITANRVYFGLDNGGVAMVNNANTGTSLTGVFLNPNGGVRATVSCVAVDPASEDHILVTYSNYGVTHIFETKNASAATPTWTAVDGNYPDMPARWALFYPGDATKAIIATELGVWTTDLINGASTTWDPSNTGLANVEVDMLKYRAADHTLAAATHGRGLFTSTLPNSNDNLANLTISAGTLTPVFASGTTSYTASVTNTTTSIKVTPTTTDATATVKVNGTTVASGTASGAIALAVGPNTVTTVVTASDGTTTKTYTVTVTRAASNNAYLATINLTPAASLTVVSGPDYQDYTASEPNTTSSVTVTFTTHDPTATVKVNGTTVAAGTPSGPIALSVGPNAITIVSTAQDGVTTKTYGITVTRVSSSPASLSALQLSSGALTPVFATGTTTYTASVPYVASTITVTPTTSVGTATIKVNGTTVASGAASGPIALSVGANTITTVVTNGASTKTYTVTVTRAAASNNAYLATINLTPAASLTVVSGPDYQDYTASVPNTTSSVTVTFTTHDPTATVKVNGTTVASGTPSDAIALSVGPNTITIVSTAQDGTTTKTYGITVTRVSSSPASLSALQLSSGTLTPVFATGTTSYTASVLYAASTITVTPTTSVGTATIKVNGTTVASGAASGPIALSVGSNTITTMVTNGASTKTYTVTVTRAAASNNAYLATINLTPAASLTVVSGPDYKDYTASVPNTTSSVTVTFTTHDPTATVKVNGTTVASGTPSGAIALSVGPNTITIVSTAQDGVTAKTYGIAVTRMGPVNIPDATVSVTKPAESPQLADGVLFVHQGVSPNGDGINDFLQIDGILAYPDNKLLIMNRNGALVYEAKGYDNSSYVFDGHSNKNGQMQLAGTYFYSLDYTINGIIKHKTGFLVLKY